MKNYIYIILGGIAAIAFGVFLATKESGKDSSDSLAKARQAKEEKRLANLNFDTNDKATNEAESGQSQTN